LLFIIAAHAFVYLIGSTLVAIHNIHQLLAVTVPMPQLKDPFMYLYKAAQLPINKIIYGTNKDKN
jgi:hypothetical protein